MQKFLPMFFHLIRTTSLTFLFLLIKSHLQNFVMILKRQEEHMSISQQS